MTHTKTSVTNEMSRILLGMIQTEAGKREPSADALASYAHILQDVERTGPSSFVRLFTSPAGLAPTEQVRVVLGRVADLWPDFRCELDRGRVLLELRTAMGDLYDGHNAHLALQLTRNAAHPDTTATHVVIRARLLTTRVLGVLAGIPWSEEACTSTSAEIDREYEKNYRLPAFTHHCDAFKALVAALGSLSDSYDEHGEILKELREKAEAIRALYAKFQHPTPVVHEGDKP